MYLLNISYTRQPSDVPPHVASHDTWVKQHIDDGSLLFAGPRRSGPGGVTLAGPLGKPALMQLIAGDSHVQADVADYQISEFDGRLAAAGCAGFLAG